MRGKLAGVRCLQLNDRGCNLFGDERRPAVCSPLPAPTMYGLDRDQALRWLARLALATR